MHSKARGSRSFHPRNGTTIRIVTRVATIVIACSFCLTFIHQAHGSRDPETGVVRLLHLGKVWLRPNYPGSVFKAEPRISWTPVSAYPVPECTCHHMTTFGDHEVRELRKKLPRSREDLLSNYDVVLIDAMYAFDMPPLLATWIVDSVKEDGLGFMMVDDEVTFAGAGHAPSWYQTPIGFILPVDDVPSVFGWNERFEIMPMDPDHPLMKGLDFSGIWLVANNRPSARMGSKVIAEMSPTCVWNVDKPAIVYWDLGEGRSFAYNHRWHSELGNFYQWKYHPDFLCHLIYFTAQIPIPQDLALVHDTRNGISRIETEWMVLLSTMDMADRFGANLAPVNRQLDGLYMSKLKADRLYIEQEFNECISVLDRLDEELHLLIETTIDLKDGVMGWIFAIEWLTVSGTSMLAGIVVWTIMVRRRMYQEVRTTRLILSEGEKQA